MSVDDITDDECDDRCHDVTEDEKKAITQAFSEMFDQESDLPCVAAKSHFLTVKSINSTINQLKENRLTSFTNYCLSLIKDTFHQHCADFEDGESCS